ncbi:Fc receptor-like protein 6 [Dendrobates tinctorius]|uniref:Fc receptor-like protein 6 n=1 Tax=Dendrobates tinctorius TaxID=92724 RepID=UPI003CC994D5
MIRVFRNTEDCHRQSRDSWSHSQGMQPRGWVILQTPNYVYEGDNLTLSCHHYPGYTAGQTIFYKDNTVLQNWGYNNLFHIPSVVMEMTGTYKCTKQVKHHLIYYSHGDEETILVRELFMTPIIKVIPNPKQDNVTLKCETSLHPSRLKEELQFAFYKGGQILQQFSFNDTCDVYIVQRKDSGRYSCDVKTGDGRVKKRSLEKIIQRRGQ